MRRMGQIAGLTFGCTLAAVLPPTPAAAASPAAAARGYRLREYRWDAILGHRWAVLEDSAHPGRPLLSEIDDPESHAAASMPGATGGAGSGGASTGIDARPALGSVALPPASAVLASVVPGAAAPALPPTPAAPAAPVIRAGDLVTLWNDEASVRMQFAAVAQGNAAVGERIQLRVIGAGINGNAGWQAAGVVRGPGSVEMER